MPFSRGLRHVQLRKRASSKKLAPYPHPHPFKGFLDRAIYFIGVSGPLMTFPQAFKIWSTSSAIGLSLFTWAWYVFISVVWLVYGIAHHEKPLIATYILWIIANSSVVLGIFLYG